MTPTIITSIFISLNPLFCSYILGIIVGILLCLAWGTSRRRDGYQKWIQDWEKVEWSQNGYRNGSESNAAGDEFMIKIRFAWKGVAAKYLLEMIEAEMKRRVGYEGVVRVEVLRRKGF